MLGIVDSYVFTFHLLIHLLVLFFIFGVVAVSPAGCPHDSWCFNFYFLFFLHRVSGYTEYLSILVAENYPIFPARCFLLFSACSGQPEKVCLSAMQNTPVPAVLPFTRPRPQFFAPRVVEFRCTLLLYILWTLGGSTYVQGGMATAAFNHSRPPTGGQGSVFQKFFRRTRA